MHLYVGTSGYSYREWKGCFYPHKLPAGDMLRYYAERLPAVEINNTFYRLPKESVLETWAEQVPENFRFVLKASRRITHIKRLKEAEDETAYLIRTATTLEKRLGAILFQLPPYLRKDLERLEAFLKVLPEGTPAAFEFRHESWLDEEVLGALRGRDCALCVTDTGDGRPPGPIVSTAAWGYLRLRKPKYTKSELANWVTEIRSQEWKEAFVFFKHEEDGAGPELAAKFLGQAAL